MLKRNLIHMKGVRNCKIDSISIFGIVIVAVAIIIIGSILSTLPATQETDAVTKHQTKKCWKECV